MFLELRIPKELVNWQRVQSELFKVKSPTRKTDVWGTRHRSQDESLIFFGGVWLRELVGTLGSGIGIGEGRRIGERGGVG